MTASPPANPSPLIRDPRTIPVVGTDAHLPALPAERLKEGWLRERLRDAHHQKAAMAGDGAAPERFADRPAAAASVLVPIVCRPGALTVLLTRRTDHLRDHAGQISFPGGRVEPDDADAVHTALREAQEEVGLAAGQVEVIGCLPTYTTVTRFVVTPVVGLVAPDHRLSLDTFEVAEAFEVPLEFLMNPAHHQRHRFDMDGASRQFLSMPWHGEAGSATSYFIWGATAAMLRNLYHQLAE